MSENTQGRRAIWPIAIVALLAVAVVVVAVFAGGNAGADPEAAVTSPPATQSGTPTPVPPTPTVYPTATPGATAEVEQPAPAPPVSFDEPATTESGLVVEVAEVTAVEAGRDIPGEKAGPAVMVAVTVRNTGDTDASTAGSSINLTYGGDEQTPAATLVDDRTQEWPQTIAAGDSAHAAVVFAVPVDTVGDLRVIVDLLAGEPAVVFVGSRPE